MALNTIPLDNVLCDSNDEDINIEGVFNNLKDARYDINKPVGFGSGVGIISFESELIYAIRFLFKV